MANTNANEDLTRPDAPSHTRVKGWKWIFVQALREQPNVSRAAGIAEVARAYVYEARAADPEFAAAWDEAIQQAVDDLEAEAFKRAKDGVEETIIHKGKLVTIRRYSDVLAIALLKAHRREVYGDRQTVEHTGQGGGPIRVETGPDDKTIALALVDLASLGYLKPSDPSPP